MLVACAANNLLSGAEVRSWQTALAGMPLPAPAPLLNRDNAVCLLLDAFRSNDLVRALIVLPGVSDDFYLINRDRPKLNLRATNLLEAVNGLTNATAVQVTFKAPFLLLHLAADRIEPRFVIRDQATVGRLRSERHLAHPLYCDTHWERLQPELGKALGRLIWPQALSADAWHFDRHNFAGWGATDWELLVAISLASGTTFCVQTQAIIFRVQD